MTNHQDEQKSGSWGIALLVGLAAGVATGLFLKSEKGEEMTEDAKKQMRDIQKQLTKKFKGLKKVTKETYEEMVDDLVSQYGETKDLAEEQLKKMKQNLLDQWEHVREQLEDDK